MSETKKILFVLTFTYIFTTHLAYACQLPHKPGQIDAYEGFSFYLT